MKCNKTTVILINSLIILTSIACHYIDYLSFLLGSYFIIMSIGLSAMNSSMFKSHEEKLQDYKYQYFDYITLVISSVILYYAGYVLLAFLALVFMVLLFGAWGNVLDMKKEKHGDDIHG